MLVGWTDRQESSSGDVPLVMDRQFMALPSSVLSPLTPPHTTWLFPPHSFHPKRSYPIPSHPTPSPLHPHPTRQDFMILATIDLRGMQEVEKGCDDEI